MSYRSAFFVLFGVFVLHFSRILFYGEVIFPHDNSLEVGLSEKPNGTRISNRKFSDESSVFIPELANNLSSNRKASLPTWNPTPGTSVDAFGDDLRFRPSRLGGELPAEE